MSDANQQSANRESEESPAFEDGIAAGSSGAPGAAEPKPMRHPFLVYTSLRLILLIAVGATFYVLGIRGILLILLAFLVSAVASYFLLNNSRYQVGLRVGGYFSRLNQRIDASAAAEDDYLADDDAVSTDTEDEPAHS